MRPYALVFPEPGSEPVKEEKQEDKGPGKEGAGWTWVEQNKSNFFSFFIHREVYVGSVGHGVFLGHGD